MSEGVRTRAGNKTAHPAAKLVPKRRRSTTEIQAQKKAKAQDQAAEDSQVEKAVTKLAELENRQQQQDEDMEIVTNPAPSSRADEVDNVLVVEDLLEQQEPETHDNKQPEEWQEESPGLGEDGEYVKPPSEEDDDEGGDDAEMELDDLEIAGKQPSSRKKIRTGRAEVEAKRKSLKQSKDADSQMKAKKTKRIGGLSDEWQAAQQAAKGKDKNSSSDSTPGQREPEVEIQVNDYAGLEDDARDDTINEREVTVASSTERVADLGPQTLVKIKTTITCGDPATRRKGKSGHRAKPKVTELAPELRQAFGDTIAPLIREYAGAQDVWFKISVQDLEALLSKGLGHTAVAKYDLSDPTDALMKLCAETLHQWRNQFAQEAEEAVKTLISEDEHLDSKEKIKDFVTYMLGDEAGKAPFVYESWGGGTKRSGRFAHPLIIATFAHHVAKVLMPVEAAGHKTTGSPQGALIHCILAANRALRFWKTGEFMKPTGRASHYSQDNWGDTSIWVVNDETKEKVLQLVARTSRWNKSVKKLGAEEWRRLHEEAIEYAQIRYADIPEVVADPSTSSGLSEADDFELESDGSNRDYSTIVSQLLRSTSLLVSATMQLYTLITTLALAAGMVNAQTVCVPPCVTVTIPLIGTIPMPGLTCATGFTCSTLGTGTVSILGTSVGVNAGTCVPS
ncbi:uncharacterized protein PHACADRAFT_194902 [Phanerochaete carnosa HHB-10118-sp]|uniref:Uncharacterized protein n=1 Tax=Phanerochaete carnosa (strain HHB-10118-sp) TaxID=650164 RepID=K5WDL6_PHACS|nr:uncharacterized protein PHACADRAFT_194902 [Phanerochaete carnosa HHB-10118-sp]EKM57345.1 hypothetical protein PHACADRAFT_194902 [Phanerochaete carnosa HHB-10118-sp]